MKLLMVSVNDTIKGVCCCGTVVENPSEGQLSCSVACTGEVLPNGRKRSESASLQECVASALPYESKTKWREACSRYYHRAHRQGWMSFCISHMPKTGNSQRKKENRLTKAEDLNPDHNFLICQQDALQYASREQWKKNSRSLYNYAKRHGIYDEIVKDMINISPAPVCFKSPDGILYENAFVSASRYSSVEDMKTHDSSSYHAAIKYRWNICFKHMPKTNAELLKQQRCLDSAKKHLSFSQWKKSEPYYYRVARLNHWIFYILLNTSFQDSPLNTMSVSQCYKLAQSRKSFSLWLFENGQSVTIAKACDLLEMIKYGLDS